MATNTAALIYARVSTEDQLEKYGIPLQLRACREYAAAQGLTVLAEITDDGISGTVLSRPGLDEVRKRVASAEVQAVVVYDVDRLSRELVHLLILKPEIEKHARLEFVAARFEDSPSGRLFFGLRGVIGQYEREQFRERTLRGKKERAASGLIVGGRVAYGYRYDAGKLVPVEDRAQTVREIFAQYESGLSIRSIAQRLREHGTPTWQGSGWGHSSVRRILVNETYAGVAHYGTHRREGKLLKVRESLADRICLAVPALVSHEQWARVQSRLAENPAQGRPSNRYLLRGILHCSCGRRMSGNSRRGYVSYRCNGRDTMRLVGSPVCRRTILAPAVDTAVWGAIAGAFVDEEILRGILARRLAELQAPASGFEALDAKRAGLAKLQRKEKIVLAALLDPDLDEGRDQIKAEYRRVQQERARLEWEIASTERAARSYADAAGWLDATVAAIREYIPTLEANEQRQEFLRGLVSRVEWNGEEQVKINCVLGSELSTTSGRCGQFDTAQLIEFALIARVA